MKYKIQIFSASISLLALLSYTFVHTGGLLARYIKPEIVGYIAAIGIELSIVSLSLRIGDMRKLKQPNSFFLFVLIAVVAVSAVANVAEGFYVSMGTQLTSETFRQLDTIQAIIGLMATAIISLIVFALSEIAGNDVSAIIKKAEREQKKLDNQTQVAPNSYRIATESVTGTVVAQPKQPAQPNRLRVSATNLETDDGKPLTEAQRRIVNELTSNPKATNTEIADTLGVSRQAVDKQVAKMKVAVSKLRS